MCLIKGSQSVKRVFTRLLIFAFLLASLALGAAAWWLHSPMRLIVPPGSQVLDLGIEHGTHAAQVADAVLASGADVNALLLQAWFRVSGQARKIKAGSYEITPGATPRSLLRMLVSGDQSLKSITLVEGWSFNQVREALQKAELLTPDSIDLQPEMIMDTLGKSGIHPEGRFFPDTYSYAKGSSDLALLKRAAKAMDKRLDAAWALRRPDTPLKTRDEALTLASIVEKETGKPTDRAQIAGVFTNRLRINMRLQTDPTVIYGLGASFDGNLRRADLQTDHPWNTYVHRGLPPTPIALPGMAALQATLHPATSKALYFVARGDGSSQFSENLADHNAAVDRYQRSVSTGKAQ